MFAHLIPRGATKARSTRRLRGGWGSTTEEQARRLQGDGLIPHPDAVTTHAISIAVPPEAVWPWLAQMGYGRGGWYTPPIVDRLWRVRNPSVDHIEPDLQHLEAGQIILDGPPGTAIFEVVDVCPNRHLVLHSRRHPLTGKPPQGTLRASAFLDFSWVFVLYPESRGMTRLLLRTRSRSHPWWLRLVARLVLLPADLLMGRWMLKGIARRAEGILSVVD